MTQAAILASNGGLMTAPSGTAPAYQCRAWVNFNGTGTVAIRASGNVSSITDTGTGTYTVNFITAMPDANYAAVGSCDYAATNAFSIQTNARSTSALNITAVKADLSNYEDKAIISIAIFR